MRFTPNHIVSYKGKFYTAGETFEIDQKDVEELRQFGDVETEEQSADDPPRRVKKKE